MPAKLEHLYLFDPCRTKILTLDLFFNNYETIRQRCVKLYFSESLEQVKSVGMVFDNIEGTFEFDPCKKTICDPKHPVQDVTWQQYEIMPGKSGELGNLVPKKFSYLERNFSVPNKEIHKKYWKTLIMFQRNYAFFPALYEILTLGPIHVPTYYNHQTLCALLAE